MTIKQFKDLLSSGQIKFEDTMQVIEDNFEFSPTKFKNGKTINEEGQNSGSCKLFALAKEIGLSEEDTLKAFGQYYKEVLDTPEGESHQNIRNFMKFGWSGISFEKTALSLK